MHVVQLNKYYPPWIGGVERSVRLLSEELAREPGLRVSALVCNDRRVAVKETMGGVDVVRCARHGRLSSAPFSFDMARRLRELRPDVIHLHHPFPPGELAALRAAGNARMVVTWHSDIVRQRLLGALYGPLLRRLLDRVDRILVTSENYIAVSSHLEPYRDKCRVVPLGVDASRVSPDEGQRARAATLKASLPDGPVALFVGRLAYYKGIEYLVDALAHVNVQLLVVTGDGPSPKLRDRAVDRGVADRIHIRTAVPDEELPVYYAAADFLVLPSIALSEAFGLVQVEAMLAGTPVVSSNLPTGVTYVNREGETGLTVPPRDAAALGTAMHRLATDADLRRRLGAYARERALELFTKERMAAQVAGVYSEISDWRAPLPRPERLPAEVPG